MEKRIRFTVKSDGKTNVEFQKDPSADSWHELRELDGSDPLVKEISASHI